MNEFETAPLPSDRKPAPADYPPAGVLHGGAPAGPPVLPIIEHEDPPLPETPPPVEPPPPTPTGATAKPPEKSGGGSNLLTIVLFLGLAGGLYYTYTNPRPATGGADLATLRHQVQSDSDQASQATAQLQTLAQQVQTLSDRVDKLEKSNAAAATQSAATPAPTPADTTDLTKRLDDLSARVEALANRPAAPATASDTSTPPPAQPAAQPVDTAAIQQSAQQAGQQAAQQAVDALAQKIEQTLATANTRLDQVATQQKSADDALAARMDKLEQGAGQVENAADRAARLSRVQSAEVALQAGEKLGAIPNAPPALARFADTAPPTEAALREAFPAVAAHAREVSRPDLSQKTFLERTLSRLQQSVTVRQGDDVLVGDPAAGVLADAESKLQNDDLQGTVRTLGHLSGPAAQAVQGWVEQANALLAARDALAAMAARP